MGLIAGTLKDLEQDEIADEEWFPTGCDFQFDGRGRPVTAQVRDPD
jgi:hypothetical protein